MKKPFTIGRDQLDGVIALLRVAERRSFRAAAEELGVSPSAISQTIRAHSSEALQVETGSLYPALHRLQKQKWVKASWGLTETNQRAKFYTLTPAGKKQLLRERDRWEQLIAAIGGVLNPNPAKG